VIALSRIWYDQRRMSTTPIEQVLDPTARLQALHDQKLGQYALGTGDYHPKHDAQGHLIEDLPWTTREKDGAVGSDCAGAVCYAHRLKRHRPGFGKGGFVEDDMNTDSILWDACHAQDVSVLINGYDFNKKIWVRGAVQAGDIIVYQAIRKNGKVVWPYVGHTGGVKEVLEGFDPQHPDWLKLMILHCCGGDFRKPAIVLTTGSPWANHEKTWLRDEFPERGACIVRVRPDVHRYV
jgi:hypothetical protein